MAHPPLEANRPARGQRAFVTLVTNADFALGARVLMQSLIHSGTDADLVVLHSDAVAEPDLRPLRALGVRLMRTGHLPLSHAFNAAHARDRLHGAAPFTKGTKPLFHTPLDNFLKLRLWQLDYDTCVFLDSDTLVVQNVDRLFHYPAFSAAPNVYESLADFRRMNSGVFVARPCATEFARMMTRLEGRFWKRTDQTFLQEMFPDWHGLPIYYNMLQYSYFNLPELWDWNHVKIIHYQYEKPWEKDHARSDALRQLVDLWRSFEQGRAPELPRAA